MKKKNLVIALAVATIAISFTACKKTSGDAETATLASQSSISDNLTEDANNVFTQTVNNDTTGTLGAARPAPYYNATVTISPAVGFPKTITINFGSGTTSQDLIYRTGEIQVVLSDSFRLNGTTATLSFLNNYTVDGYAKTGTITWTNQSVGDTLKWTRVDSGTVTAPDGSYWHHSGQRVVVQTAGFGDNNLLDNVYSITGNHTIVNSEGITGTSIILIPLEKKADCFFIDAGQIRINGPKHYAVIDFGNGTCDDNATFALDGGTVYGFRLW
ncbi:MAG TPA: hypothetical protein VK718_11990 [Ferruginibacter sp.]|jgi:hypothetical protein|nr:hypothetical protein [Ferruginibacter sp.]